MDAVQALILWGRTGMAVHREVLPRAGLIPMRVQVLGVLAVQHHNRLRDANELDVPPGDLRVGGRVGAWGWAVSECVHSSERA